MTTDAHLMRKECAQFGVLSVVESKGVFAFVNQVIDIFHLI